MDSRRVEKINSAIFTQKRRHYSASRKRCSMERESFRRISPKFKRIVTNDRWNWSVIHRKIQKDTRSSSLLDERRIFLKFRQIHRKMDSKRLEKIISSHFHAKKDTRSSSLLDEKKIFSKFRQMIRKFHDPSKNGLVTLRENKFSHFSRQPGYTIVVIADEEIPRSIEKWIQNT